MQLRFNEENRTQVLSLLAISVAWGLFTQSAIFAKGLSWAPFLLGGRIGLSVLAAGLALWLLCRPRANVLSVYLLGCIGFQAICAVLEAPKDYQFYEYVSFLTLLNVMAYDGPVGRWLKYHLPVVALGYVVPLLFKDPSTYSSLGALLYNLTTPIVVAFVAAVVLRLSTTRFAALRTNIELQGRLLTAEREAKDKATRELERAKRKIEEDAVKVAIAGMTQMLAHDVRRPFSTLRVALSMIRASKNDPSRLAALPEKIEAALLPAMTKVDGLIADVMEIGSNRPPNREPVVLAELVDEVLQEVFPSGAPTGVSVRREGGLSLSVAMERRKLLRAVSNIVQNAREAIEERGGDIRFSAACIAASPGFCRLTIANSNSHIPPDAVPRIFDSFFTEGKRGGTGLGLAIAKKVVKDHGGFIAVESDSKAGVAFHLDLPLTTLAARVGGAVGG